jgi:hypothetical protein
MAKDELPPLVVSKLEAPNHVLYLIEDRIVVIHKPSGAGASINIPDAERYYETIKEIGVQLGAGFGDIALAGMLTGMLAAGQGTKFEAGSAAKLQETLSKAEIVSSEAGHG